MNYWLFHDGFKDFVANEWNPNVNLMEAISQFITKLKDWNVNVFFRQKKILLARIEGIQKVLAYCNNPFLADLEHNLKNELHLILLREEMIWEQKSRSSWISWGDKNTNYQE